MRASRDAAHVGKPRSSCTQCRKRKQRVRPNIHGHRASRLLRHGADQERPSATEYGPAITVPSVPLAIYATLGMPEYAGPLRGMAPFGAGYSWADRSGNISLSAEDVQPPTESDTSGRKADFDEDDPSSRMEALGYRNGLDHFNLGMFKAGPSEEKSLELPSTINTALSKAIAHVPQRGITDTLVQSYLKNDNMQYYSIHPQSFLREYDDWWAARGNNEPVSAAWTSLLLQVSANAMQAPDRTLKLQLQHQLAETEEEMSSRLFRAARELGQTVPTGSGGLHRVMQLLLAATWLKSRGSIVDGWHALSVAVREAQECGLADDDMSSFHGSEMDVELRRRTWCYMAVWDWQMAEWLSRPMLVPINENMPAPNPAVDCCGNGQLSPITNLSEQFKLVCTLSLRFGRLAELKRKDHMREAVNAIEQWAKHLPPELSIEGESDRSRDDQWAWLPLQRESLRCFAHMARLTPLKRILKRICSDAEDLELKNLAARLCFECIDAGLALHKLLKPSQRSFHFVIFVLFDTATVVCSALLHDQTQNFLDHGRLMQKAEDACIALEALAQHAQTARRGADVLRWLFKIVQSSQPETEPVDGGSKGAMRFSKNDLNEIGSLVVPSNYSQVDPTPLSPKSMANTSELRPSVLEDSTWLPIPPDPTLDSLLDLDLGGIESIWDWEALGLAASTDVS